MRNAVDGKTYTVEEYIRFEWQSERRHEFINGKLFEMPGEKDINNQIAGLIYILLINFLKDKGYQLYNHDVKVAVPGEKKFYYPDVFATKEERSTRNQYIKYEPEIIVEVVSETTQVTDYVDKYIDYTKIPSLTYYIIAEPETTLITVYEKEETGNWIARKFTNHEDVITLDKTGIEFRVKNIYKG
jgi:Uma2 family endonuclease